MSDGRPLTLTLSPQTGRGDTPSPAGAGEGWGEGGFCGKNCHLFIRISIETRLDNLAAKTGRTKTYFAREAICEYLDDLEDYYLAEARTRSSAKTISLDEVERRLGLAD